MTRTVAKLNRTTQALCAQLCSKQTLDYGIAYYCDALPNVAELNQYREVIEKDPAKMPSIIDEAESWFGERGHRCLRFATADSNADRQLASFLQGNGYLPFNYAALGLAEWKSIETADDVRVIPGRAVRTALEKTFIADERHPDPKNAAAVAAERMDFPEYDLFVALVGNQPAGRCALYQVGDIARVMNLFVLPQFASSGVRETLLAHVLSLAKRLAIPTVCSQLPESRNHELDLFQRAGFVENGRMVEFERTP